MASLRVQRHNRDCGSPGYSTLASHLPDLSLNSKKFLISLSLAPTNLLSTATWGEGEFLLLDSESDKFWIRDLSLRDHSLISPVPSEINIHRGTHFSASHLLGPQIGSNWRDTLEISTASLISVTQRIIKQIVIQSPGPLLKVMGQLHKDPKQGLQCLQFKGRQPGNNWLTNRSIKHRVTYQIRVPSNYEMRPMCKESKKLKDLDIYSDTNTKVCLLDECNVYLLFTWMIKYLIVLLWLVHTLWSVWAEISNKRGNHLHLHASMACVEKDTKGVRRRWRQSTGTEFRL